MDTTLINKPIKIDVFQNGATWLRVDFHLHTNKDKEFQYDGNDVEYISTYIAKLIKEQVQVGVITNHNKFDKDEFKCLRKQAKKNDIWLIPGVELSVCDGANGIHCLIVFDESTWLNNGENYIEHFLVAAFEGICNRENENQRCKYSLEQLLQKLEEHQNQGRDSFVILAHVEDSRGFFEELDGGRIQQIARTELFHKFVLGLQKIRTYSKLETYRHWFATNLPACVEGSDCKNIEEVGKASIQNGREKKTYVKIGSFNFEALKYALMDYNHRVSDEQIISSNSYIKSIQFIGGKLDGQVIHFSPELNNFIGIRGSGKSSIIEILRYTLGINLSHSSADEVYKNNLISYILGSGGKVIVLIHNKKDEQVYRVEKIYGQKSYIFNNLTNEIKDCSIEAILDTPIYFGQKDLSNKQDDFESDLLQRLIGSRLREKDSEVQQLYLEISEIINETNKIKNLDYLKEETNKIIKDAEQNLAYFTAAGVEKKLKSQTLFEQDSLTISKQGEKILQYEKAIEDVITDFDGLFSNSLNGSEKSTDIFSQANIVLGDVYKTVSEMKMIHSKVKSLLEKFETLKCLIEEKRSEMAEEFAKIKREIHSDTLNPDTFITLNRVINTSKIKLTEIEKQIARKEELNLKLLAKLSELENLWHEQYQIKKQEIDKINRANGNLVLEIEYKGQRGKLYEELKNIFRGTNIREVTYQSIIENFIDFVAIHRDKEKFAHLFPSCSDAFMERYNSNMSELLTFRVEDKVTIKYKGKPLTQHSLGQRASALIVFLLAQKDNDVLIIDQPEDDLDNQTIYEEVIREIIKLKGQMQFIFATHNANIPVLGDSEHIVACSFEDNTKINMQMGSIDVPTIQKSIVNIMEGGKDAFNKRKYIYNIWK